MTRRNMLNMGLSSAKGDADFAHRIYHETDTKRTLMNDEDIPGNWDLIGLGYEVATQAQANAGTSDDTVMTPKKVLDRHLLGTRAASDNLTLYPLGVSIFHKDSTNSTGWPNSSTAEAIVMTEVVSSSRAHQVVSFLNSLEVYSRWWDSGGNSWGVWSKTMPAPQVHYSQFLLGGNLTIRTSPEERIMQTQTITRVTAHGKIAPATTGATLHLRKRAILDASVSTVHTFAVGNGVKDMDSPTISVEVLDGDVLYMEATAIGSPTPGSDWVLKYRAVS